MQIDKAKLYGVAVWYNPNSNNITNYKSYIDEIHTLFVVDNSESDNSHFILQKYKNKIIYLPNKQNLGIATALNIGCRAAIERGAQWILTMDQDSCFTTNTVDEYIREAKAYNSLDTVGIFSPVHQYGEKIKKRKRYEPQLTVMTSGNLLQADIFMKLGGFRDDFFIDLVDDEYCCRLHKNNYNVIRTTRIVLQHHLGEGLKKVWWFPKKTFIQHNALRHYYIIRNSLKIIELYPEFSKYYKKQLQKRLKRTLLYDSQKKWQKIKYMYLGWLDYKRDKFGRFSH